MKELLRSSLIGACISSFIFMLFIVSSTISKISSFNAISIIIMGALIGLTIRILLKTSLSYLMIIIIHLVMTTIITNITFFLNDWIVNLNQWLIIMVELLFIYLITWLIVIFTQKKSVNEVNKLIRMHQNKP